jgi:hypothetical protein
LALGLGAFGAGRGGRGGEVAGVEAAQSEIRLDLAALLLGALAIPVGAGAAAVGADGGGEDMDVVVRVPYGDPPARPGVAFGGDSGGGHDAAGDLGPLGVSEVAVGGGGPDRAVPHVLWRFVSAQFTGAEVDVVVQALGELGVGGVRVTAGVGGAGHVPGGDDVRVGVLVPSALAEEVGDQPSGVGAGGDVRNHAVLLRPGAGRSSGSSRWLLARHG